MHTLMHWLFTCFRISICPCCHQITTFSQPVPVAYGVPAEYAHLVPQVVKCRRNGCTSSVRAVVSLEKRKS